MVVLDCKIENEYNEGKKNLNLRLGVETRLAVLNFLVLSLVCILVMYYTLIYE